MTKPIFTKETPEWQSELVARAEARQAQANRKSFSQMSRAEKDELLRELLLRFEMIPED